MIIAFEGIDGAGKSTLSLHFAAHANSHYIEQGWIDMDSHFGDFIWTKEPTFSSEEADLLNSQAYMDQYRRERLFFENRIHHQRAMAGKNVMCDRYLWSGMAYAYKYSPDCFRLLKEMYMSDKLFMQPDLYVFVDTPVEICLERKPESDIDILRELREAYLRTQCYVKSPVITVSAVKDENQVLSEFVELFEDHIRKNEKLQ